MCGKYSLNREFANFLIIAKIANTFGSKMVAISTRNTIIQLFQLRLSPSKGGKVGHQREKLAGSDD